MKSNFLRYHCSISYISLLTVSGKSYSNFSNFERISDLRISKLFRLLQVYFLWPFFRSKNIFYSVNNGTIFNVEVFFTQIDGSYCTHAQTQLSDYLMMQHAWWPLLYVLDIYQCQHHVLHDVYLWWLMIRSNSCFCSRISRHPIFSHLPHLSPTMDFPEKKIFGFDW